MAGTTWEGEAVAAEPPFGATVVVWRAGTGGRAFLVLRRADRDGCGCGRDWLWGPPAGARHPGEAAAACAARELREETGLVLDLRPVAAGGDWAVFVAEAPATARPRLSGEHDAYAWLPLARAVARCRPAQVARAILRADQALNGR